MSKNWKKLFSLENTRPNILKKESTLLKKQLNKIQNQLEKANNEIVFITEEAAIARMSSINALVAMPSETHSVMNIDNIAPNAL